MRKDLALKRTEEISLPFLLTAFPFDRIFKPGEYQAWHFVHSAGKCWEKILLAPATRAHAQQAGRSPVARQSIEVFAFHIYLVRHIPAISGVSGLALTRKRKNGNYKL